MIALDLRAEIGHDLDHAASHFELDPLRELNMTFTERS
jgi:hypothetical protein